MTKNEPLFEHAKQAVTQLNNQYNAESPLIGLDYFFEPEEFLDLLPSRGGKVSAELLKTILPEKTPFFLHLLGSEHEHTEKTPPPTQIFRKTAIPIRTYLFDYDKLAQYITRKLQEHLVDIEYYFTNGIKPTNYNNYRLIVWGNRLGRYDWFMQHDCLGGMFGPVLAFMADIGVRDVTTGKLAFQPYNPTRG